MTEAAKGVAAMIGACVIWASSMIFYRALAPVPPLEILAHRTVWTVAFFGVVLAFQGRLGQVRTAFGAPTLAARVAFAAAMVATNWFFFVLAVQTGRALQSSLGYYIFPLVAVGLGYLVLGERFSRGQSFAVGLAAVAVVLLTAGLGDVPWISLVLAVTFGFYGLAKSRIALGPAVSVFAETLLLLPLALAWIALVELGRMEGSGAWFGASASTTLMLVASGPLTGIPLMLFSYATRRADLAIVGLIQYLNPTLQFLIAVALFGEAFTALHGTAFLLIWTALALYSWETWRTGGPGRRKATEASGKGTVRIS